MIGDLQRDPMVGDLQREDLEGVASPLLVRVGAELRNHVVFLRTPGQRVSRTTWWLSPSALPVQASSTLESSSAFVLCTGWRLTSFFLLYSFASNV